MYPHRLLENRVLGRVQWLTIYLRQDGATCWVLVPNFSTLQNCNCGDLKASSVLVHPKLQLSLCACLFWAQACPKKLDSQKFGQGFARPWVGQCGKNEQSGQRGIGMPKVGTIQAKTNFVAKAKMLVGLNWRSLGPDTILSCMHQPVHQEASLYLNTERN